MTISVQGAGALYTLLLLALCIGAVAVAKLVRLGLRARRSPPPAPPEEKHPPAPEPVYYLVEKKKKRPRPSYSDPKRITFKD